MKLYSESLLSDVEGQLNSIHSQTDNPIQYAERAIKALIPAFEKLKTKCLTYKFPNKAEEIDFFHNIKPQFAAKLIYYNEIYNIETSKPLGAKKIIRKYLNTEMGKLQTYFNENKEFYKYFRTGNRSLDNKYFLRGKHHLCHTLDSFYFQADHRFTTSHDYKVAKIIANEKIKTYLENEILNLEQKSNNKNPMSNNKTQKWTGSKVALTELLFALHTEGVFNHGNTELKELASFLESVFQVDLGQFHKTFLEIRERKSDRTKFINTLREKLLIRMEEADEKQ